jgi:hypothetical protein
MANTENPEKDGGASEKNDPIGELIEVVQEELSPILHRFGIVAILAGTKIIELGQEWDHGRK